MNEFFIWLAFYPLNLALCLAGILGNILAFIGWRQAKKRVRKINTSSINYFIMLSVCDSIVLLITLFVDILPTAKPSLKRVHSFVVFYRYFGHPVHYYFVFVSLVTASAMSAERAYLVRFPLQTFARSEKLFKYFVIGIFTFSAVANLPSFFEYTTTSQYGEFELTKIDIAVKMELRNIVFTTHCILGVVLPWFVILVSNMVTLNTVIKWNKFKGRKGESTITSCILLGVTFFTLFLYGFQCVSRCATMFYGMLYTDRHTMDIVAAYGNLAISINSACKLFIFYLPGKLFRNSLSEIFKNRVSPIQTPTITRER